MDTSQVATMLQCSTKVASDVSLLTEENSPYMATLALKRYRRLQPSREWRCVVVDGHVTAVLQRDPTNAFGLSEEDVQKQAIAIRQFHSARVAELFPLRTCKLGYSKGAHLLMLLHMLHYL